MTTSTPETDLAPPAKAPLAAPAASAMSVVLAIALIAAGIVAGRDAFIGIGVVTGSPWIGGGLKLLDGLTAQAWMLPAGIAVALLGLLLVVAAIKPRRRTHRPTTVPNAWITPRDIRRIAAGAALSVTGVADATATGSARSLSITITAVSGYDTGQLVDAVRSAVTTALTPLASPPRLKTRVAKRDSARKEEA